MVAGLHPHNRTVSVESAEELRELGELAEQNGFEALRSIKTDSDGTGSPIRTPSAKDDSELNELLNLNPSIYDMTVQYSCLACHRAGGKAGFPSLLTILFLEAVNVFTQLMVLHEVHRKIAKPAEARANLYYSRFTTHCSEELDSDALAQCFNEWADDQNSGRELLAHVSTHLGATSHPTEAHTLCAYPLTAPGFFMLILTIWTFYLTHELKQTVYFWWHILTLGMPNEGRVTILQHGDNFIITHMSQGLKIWVSVVVFVPKLMIASILWYIGAGWLTATTGTDNLVLNSLALTFICEIDELIFRTCMPEVAKACLEKTKLPLPSFKYTPSYWIPAETLGTCLGCIAMAAVYICYWQDAIIDYRWDLEDVCEKHAAHVAEMMHST
jgi:hypothetical protein